MSFADLPRFHLAIPVPDIDAVRPFYCELLGCGTGREADRWLDLNFFGHQITLHVADDHAPGSSHNEVDSKAVPVRHFGVILPLSQWHELSDRLQAANVDFVIEPGVRFAGQVGEQWTLFLLDPAGNALEFKSFANPDAVFSTA